MQSRRADRGKRRRLIVIGPLPPPTHGVAVSTDLTLANRFLKERFEIEHLDTSDRRSTANIGAWDATNVMLGLRNLGQLVKRLRGRRGVVYLPLSENFGAFARDSLFIHAASLARWSVAVHIRNSTFHQFYEALNPLARWWVRLTLSRIRSVAVLGSRLRPIFDGLVPPERITVVPNGTPDVSLGNIVRDPNLVLFLSNLIEKKGIAEAVETALIVVRRSPTARVVFAGEWRDRGLERRLRARAEADGERIEFLPPVTGDEKEQLLQSCSVLLFPPKLGEGQPRIVLEAMCRGIPIVTTDRGAIAETVTDGKSAFVLDDPDPDALAERVLQLLEDARRREEMGKAARERYEARYTQEKTDRTQAQWLALVADGPGARG